jgi:hypothetical protein
MLRGRLQFAVCSLQFAVCSLQFAVCSLQFAVCSLQFAVSHCIEKKTLKTFKFLIAFGDRTEKTRLNAR